MPDKKAPVVLNHGSDFTREEFATLLKLARRAVWASPVTRRALQEHRINVIPATFYSDIPLLADLDTSFEFAFADGPYNSPKVFDRPRMEKFLADIGKYADEFDPPVEGDPENPQGYFWRNPAFSYSDAMAYYCVLRYLKPGHVLEVGSGFSTLVALRALEKNERGKLSCIEPFPMPWLSALGDRLTLHVTPVQSLEPDFFNQNLTDGDVFFIDSTHTVKAGSDCLHLYLRVLPSIRSDVTVHAHDIYLPFPFDRVQAERHVYWTEQYLLYAYLLENPRTKVLYGSRYHRRLNKPQLDAFMRGRWKSGGASFWFSQSGMG
jgi:Methyltransferase domain